MSYPTMSPVKADELAAILRPLPEVDRLSNETDEANWTTIVASGNYDRAAVEAASAQAKADWDAYVTKAGGHITSRDRERLEAKMAGIVHGALRGLPVAVLADHDFWRYLALFPFRWYLNAREPEWQSQDYGGQHVTVDDEGRERRGKHDLKRQLVFRTFLWGKAAFDEKATDPYERATKVGAGDGAEIDVWHSHIIRVQLGHLGTIPHHFIDSICDTPTAFDRDKGRAVEKRLTRMKHNVLFDIYGEDGRKLVDDQKAQVV